MDNSPHIIGKEEEDIIPVIMYWDMENKRYYEGSGEEFLDRWNNGFPIVMIDE